MICTHHHFQEILTVEELLEGISVAEKVSEDVERVSEDEVHPGIHAAERIALQVNSDGFCSFPAENFLSFSLNSPYVMLVVMVRPAPPRVEPGEQVVDVGAGPAAGAAAATVAQPLAAELVVHLALAL